MRTNQNCNSIVPSVHRKTWRRTEPNQTFNTTMEVENKRPNLRADGHGRRREEESSSASPTKRYKASNQYDGFRFDAVVGGNTPVLDRYDTVMLFGIRSGDPDSAAGTVAGDRPDDDGPSSTAPSTDDARLA